MLVHNEKHPRGLWKIAKIKRLLEGADGQVRGPVVRISCKSSSKILRCSLNCLEVEITYMPTLLNDMIVNVKSLLADWPLSSKTG